MFLGSCRFVDVNLRGEISVSFLPVPSQIQRNIFSSHLTYHRNIKLIQIPPSRLEIRLDYIYLLKLEGPGVPYVGENRPGFSAEAAVFTSKECDPATLK